MASFCRLYFLKTMKKFTLNQFPVVIMLAAVCMACGPKVTLNVTNTLPSDRMGEMVDFPASEIAQMGEDFVICNAQGEEIPYQVTYDGKVIFNADVKANATATYTIKKGKHAEWKNVACGRQYPERDDDMAWENDRVAFRTYGPALQARGEKGFGFDLFLKYASEEPVLEELYGTALNPETHKKMKELRAAGNKAAADSISRAISYHIDHGKGMDCFAVGPTLGCCTPALLDSVGNIVYTWCYNSYEILDNGPLRFTMKLVYGPISIDGNDNVTQTRLISLDKGSQLNKTVVTFDNLQKETRLAVGISLREADPEEYVMDPQKRFISYEDLTQNPVGNDGKVYPGALTLPAFEETTVAMFPEKMGTAMGHVMGVKNYKPGTAFTYYWGYGWTKSGFADQKAWTDYLTARHAALQSPLQVSVIADK